MGRAASIPHGPRLAGAAPSSGPTPHRRRLRSQHASIIAYAIEQGHRAEIAVALAEIDPCEAAARGTLYKASKTEVTVLMEYVERMLEATPHRA
jgi:hypothetical protein